MTCCSSNVMRLHMGVNGLFRWFLMGLFVFLFIYFLFYLIHKSLNELTM